MDANSLSVQWYKRSKPVGKVRRRVQELRIPSSSYSDPLARKPMLDLSHNESVRLAADSLLSQGLAGYQQVLNAEGEVDFLSEQEKNYIQANRRNGNPVDAGTADDDDGDDDDDELERLPADFQSPSQCPAVSTDSDASVPGEEWRDTVLGQPSVEVYFQSDNSRAFMKDLVREFIRKASTALAIVTDTFTDVELLCDLLESSRKRNVSVHLLLDHLNLNLFLNMWQDLNINSKLFPKLSVRSVGGLTYCAKTGRKLTGQITENFIITDWTEVLTGSYSFSWLSWQVHRSLAVLLKGKAVTPFHQEFQRLYTSSNPVPSFFPIPPHLPFASHVVQNDPSRIRGLRTSQTRTICPWTWTEEREPTEAVCGLPTQKTQTNLEPLEQNQYQTQAQPKPQSQMQSHSNPLDQTQVPYLQSQLSGLTLATLSTDSPDLTTPQTYERDITGYIQIQGIRSRYTSRTNSNPHVPAQCAMGTLGLFFQERRRNSKLTMSSGIAVGLNIPRGQWNYSLTLIDHLSRDSQVLSSSTSQQEQAKAGLSCPFTYARGHMLGLDTQVSPLGTQRQTQSQKHRPYHLQSHLKVESPDSKTSSRGMGVKLKSQLQPQPDSKLFLPGMGIKLQLQPHTSQPCMPPPRLHWVSQRHAAIPRPMVRQRFFSSAYGTGQKMEGQLGQRPFQTSMMMSLGGTKSLIDRHSTLLKGSILNPKITKT